VAQGLGLPVAAWLPKLPTFHRRLGSQTAARPWGYGLQSRPLSLSYGSNLPTSLTLHCSSIKRLRTSGSWCGYRYGHPQTHAAVTHPAFQGRHARSQCQPTGRHTPRFL